MNSEGGGAQSVAFADSSDVNTPTWLTSGYQQATEQQLEKMYTIGSRASPSPLLTLAPTGGARDNETSTGHVH